MPKNAHRTVRAILSGLFAGLFLLACIAIPLIVNRSKESAETAILQENLTPSRGEAFSAYALAHVNIVALLNGRPSDGMSVSPDGQRWHTPQGGELSLSLIPGEYIFRTAYGNRTVTTRYTVGTDTDNTVVLDAGKAPAAPELMMLEVPDEGGVFPLDISGADNVTIDKDPAGIQVIRQDGAYALTVDPTLLPYCFYHITLRAMNEDGEAELHIGLSLPRTGQPIPVYTVEELSGIRHNLSGSYMLMNDLDMSQVHDWLPIGAEGYPFTGVFDGGGHEITGFHAPDSIPDGQGFGIFNGIQNAKLRNLIIRAPNITPQTFSPAPHCAALAAVAVQSLIENCAVIGGIIAPADGGAAGMVVDANDCILLHLFNSADVFCASANSNLKNTGGIAGVGYGYWDCLANEGEVHGTHLTGGIVGLMDGGRLSRSVNSGFIWGSTMVGEFPAGGIAQTVNLGVCAYSHFIRGQSATGGRAFSKGCVNSLIPIKADDLRSPEKLPMLSFFSREDAGWSYASLDANGPIPSAIFKKQAETPVPVWADGKVILPEADGLMYFYTLDGSDPRTNCLTGAESAALTFSGDGLLTVFTARQGCRDSKIMIFNAEGGR